MGNFLKATFVAVRAPASRECSKRLMAHQITKTYAFITPDLWREIPVSKVPYDEYSAHLQLTANKKAY
jgi:small subunit ribosomal protein S2e